MAKVIIQSDEIRKKVVKNYTDVTHIYITNLSANALYFLFNGIQRLLPGYDSEADLGNFPIFRFSLDGHHFDAKINFNGNTNNIIVDYAVLPITNNNCT